jgi:hypothetical protein
MRKLRDGAKARISYLWREPAAAAEYATGVSLHSHTNQSKETLDFLAKLGTNYSWLQPVLRKRERNARERHGVSVDYLKGYWTPPLTPRMAFDLERGQIEKLKLQALVSITDHDNINAPMLLRTVPSARHIPMSVEWSAPVGEIAVHLGIHNLPSAHAADLMAEMEWITSLAGHRSDPATNDRAVTAMLERLTNFPGVLVIFNHPLWDLYQIGQKETDLMCHEFILRNQKYLHGFELNGLRGWQENRRVGALAAEWGQLLISGGDRHGLEPNANLNLTRAVTFNDFVNEVRYQRESHVLFMPQYAEPWKHRLLRSTVDAIRNYPDAPQGMRRWDERVFHPDKHGEMCPVSEFWAKGRPPRIATVALSLVRMLGTAPVSVSLRMAWGEKHELKTLLGELA